MNELLRNIIMWIYGIVGNYGWAIVIFTFLIRALVFPLDYKSRVGMRKMQKLQPKQAELQKKYAKDQEKLNQKMSELYRKEKVNPLSSCLPMLITLPLLWIMFGAMRAVANEQIVKQVFEILQGNEVTLHGWLWIKNVFTPDSPLVCAWPDLNTMRQVTADVWQAGLANLGDAAASLPIALTAESFSNANLQATLQSIYATMQQMPEYAAMTAPVPGLANINMLFTSISIMQNWNGLFILPLLAAGSQILMTKLQPVQDTGANPQAASTSKLMNWFFPIFSLFICLNYTALFAIYWVAANVFVTAENMLINRYLDNKEKQESFEGGAVK